MQAPDFWRGDDPRARLLDPLGRLYGALGRWRRRITVQQRAPLPVICVGNLTAGGAGKTPTVLALAARLLAQGRRPHLLTRGYGGRARGPLRVDPAAHDAAAVGDEALLLAARATTWIARDRPAGAAAAAAAGAELVILDDGFQNPHLHYDLALVVVDGEVGFGNRRLLPAGPLRERIGDGLARASAIIRIGEDRQGLARDLPAALPVLAAELMAEDAAWLAGRAVVAFAGIGRPAKFFATLERLGADLVQRRAFPDHHAYHADELAPLLAAAKRRNAVCVTTAKDQVRLPPALRKAVHVLSVSLRFQDSAAADALLAPPWPTPAGIRS